MTSTSSGRKNTDSNTHQQREKIFLVKLPPTKELEPLDMIGAYLHFEKEVISVEEAEHDDWKAFISRFVKLEGDDTDVWTLQDRCDFLNYLFNETDVLKPDILVPLIKQK